MSRYDSTAKILEDKFKYISSEVNKIDKQLKILQAIIMPPNLTEENFSEWSTWLDRYEEATTRINESIFNIHDRLVSRISTEDILEELKSLFLRLPVEEQRRLIPAFKEAYNSPLAAQELFVEIWETLYPNQRI